MLLLQDWNQRKNLFDLFQNLYKDKVLIYSFFHWATVWWPHELDEHSAERHNLNGQNNRRGNTQLLLAINYDSY